MESQIDPEEALKLLADSKASVPVNDLLDFGPWWYAPMLATSIGGLTLFGRGWDVTFNVLCGIAGFGCGIYMAVHNYRSRKVRPRPTVRSAGTLMIVVLISWIVIGLWGTAASTLGDDFLPWPAVGCWLATVAFFLGVRKMSYALLDRRMAVA